MSRIGKQPIEIPQGVQVQVQGQDVTVQGAKGSKTISVHPKVSVEVKEKEVICTLADASAKSKFGLSRSLISNAISGCAEGFKKELDVVGVGYRANVSGQRLELSLGHSHSINYNIPDGIQIKVDKQTHITVEGVDKQMVGQVAAEIRGFREPEPYKGKGVKYSDERIIRKAGKAGAGA